MTAPVLGQDVDLDQIDVLSNMACTAGPPHQQLEWLRENRPLFHQKIDDPVMVGESYVVTCHTDIVQVSRDLDHFGNFAGHNLRNDHDTAVVSHMLMSDRPRHTEHYHRLAGSLLDRAIPDRRSNRDETVFENPFHFDIARDPSPQIAFGYGAHFCMGAHLARLETKPLLAELVQRVEPLEVAGPVEHTWSSFINGIKRLPITVHPA